jgi:hypothetical protein
MTTKPDMHSDAHHNQAIGFVDQNSIQDKVLSLLAILTLSALLWLGFYWQLLPLPSVQPSEETKKN